MLPILLLLVNFKMLGGGGGPPENWHSNGTPVALFFLMSSLLSVHHPFPNTVPCVFAPNCILGTGPWAGPLA